MKESEEGREGRKMLQIFIFHHYMSERASGMSSSEKRRWVLLAWK